LFGRRCEIELKKPLGDGHFKPAAVSSPSTREQLVAMLFNGPENAPVTIALAHGAGAGMDTDFMNTFAEGLVDNGLRVVRFEFPYMLERRRTGKRRPPDREPILRQTWLDVIESLNAETLVIGGKSMGGRMASLVTEDTAAAGLICLGYPFHPSGRPERLRVEHLRDLKTPTLIVQGERDPLGKREEVTGYQLSQTIQIHWVPDGDHSFKPRKASGRTLDQNLHDAISACTKFIHALPRLFDFR
jgi:predicted alpha/beta-hydrolase family hydrolase